MPVITRSEITALASDKNVTKACIFPKFADPPIQFGGTCGIYAIRYVMKCFDGAVSELPARARDVCANCGAVLISYDPTSGAKAFNQNVTTTMPAGSTKKLYLCRACSQQPASQHHLLFHQTLRQLAKAENISAIGELMDANETAAFMQKNGLKATVKSPATGYAQELVNILDAGGLALIPYDVDATTGDPGLNGGKKPHWAVSFGYFKRKAASKVEELFFLATHGWGKFYFWSAGALEASVGQMDDYPGGIAIKRPQPTPSGSPAPLSKIGLGPKLPLTKGSTPKSDFDFKRWGEGADVSQKEAAADKSIEQIEINPHTTQLKNKLIAVAP